MAQIHEGDAAELHARMHDEAAAAHDDQKRSVDMSGGSLPVAEKGDLQDVEIQGETEEGEEPNEYEKKTLRRVGDKFPKKAFLVAAVELCERFTCMFMQSWEPIRTFANVSRRLRVPGPL